MISYTMPISASFLLAPLFGVSVSFLSLPFIVLVSGREDDIVMRTKGEKTRSNCM